MRNITVIADIFIDCDVIEPHVTSPKKKNNRKKNCQPKFHDLFPKKKFSFFFVTSRKVT